MSQFAQPDMSLHLEGYFPAAGQSGILAALDLGVDVPAFSDMWRKAFLRLEWPALPNHTNASLNVPVTLLDSADGGASFQTGGPANNVSGVPSILPTIQVLIPGAANGAPAGNCDFPLPPGLRGPIAVSVVMPAGTGDNTGALLTATIFFG
jgi:hypothetical protein